jgi:hypothetical protein
MKTLFTPFALLLLCFLASCSIFDPEEPLPMFVKLGPAQVVLDPDRNLRTDIGIKDFWVEQGQEFLGVYEIGQVVPVYQTTSEDFVFTGGIFNSGLSGLRVRYPFWKAVRQSIPFSELDTFVFSPQVEYFARDTALIYPFEEDFETGGRSLVALSTAGSNVRFERSSSSRFEGGQAGRAIFTSRDTLMEIVSEIEFTLPNSGQNSIWLEFSFKSDVPFAAGLYYQEPGQPNFGPIGGDILYRSDEWTRIFVPLNDAVRALGSSNIRYRVWFRANSAGASGTLFLDYIRLIHFN